VLLPGTARAQDSAPPKERERVAIVAINAGRLGLLIPLGERWMLRPDIDGSYVRTGEPDGSVRLLTGLSLIRRTAPVQGSWTYAALRYAVDQRQGYYDDRATVGHALTITAGAHGQFNDWLAVFGEAGAGFTYFPELNVDVGDVTTQGSLLARIGIAIRKPRAASAAWTAPAETDGPIADGGERPSWVIGGFGGAGGVLIPLSDRWVLRPDLGFSALAQRDIYSEELGGVGISLLRRFAPTERGWAFTALRYGYSYDHRQARRPSWIHDATLTVGGHARLRGRLGVMAEAGLVIRYAEQREPAQVNTVTSAFLTQRVGLTYRWKDRAP
jgi:hypothetical protein